MRSNRFFDFKDGRPVPVESDAVGKDTYNQLFSAAVATPYKPPRVNARDIIEGHHIFCDELDYWIDPQELEWRNHDGSWMTCAEVAQIRHARNASYGDLESKKALDDRILGKPKQTAEITTVHGSIQDWINSAMEKEKQFQASVLVDDSPLPALPLEHEEQPRPAIITITPETIVVGLPDDDMDWL